MKRIMLSMGAIFALVIGNWSSVIGNCYAGIPQIMNYQGKLTAATGNLVANGQYDMKFAIYDAETGGTLKWTETWESPNAVPLENGLFNVLLGAREAIDLPFDEFYWLEMQVKYGGSYETLLPRQQIASGGYAYRAEKVTDGAITDASISPSAAIADTKLATISTAGKVSGTAVSGGTLGAVNGGAITNLNGDAIASGAVAAARIEDKFLRNDGDDATTGRLTAGGLTVDSGTLHVDSTNDRVGIGTTTPGAKLHVQGQQVIVQHNGAEFVYQNAAGTSKWSNYIVPADDSFRVYSYVSENAGDKVTILPGGNVGIGTTAPAAKLEIKGAGAAGANSDVLLLGAANGGSPWKFVQTDINGAENLKIQSLYSTWQDRVTIQRDSGNVGIGTTAPGTALDVVGAVKSIAVKAIHYSNPYIELSKTNATARTWYLQGIGDYVLLGPAAGGGVAVDTSGNVGIGTTAPAGKLELKDAGVPKIVVNFDYGTSSGARLFEGQRQGAGRMMMAIQPNDDWAFSTATGNAGAEVWSERLRIANSGYVGVGTTAPGYLLTCNGQPGANGYTAWANYSDRRLKENIREVEDGILEKIMKLNPSTFTYNDKYFEVTGYRKETTNRTLYGFVAQELKEVFPEMVNEKEFYGESYLDSDLTNLQIYLVKAMKEQQIQIESLKFEIGALKAKFNAGQ